MAAELGGRVGNFLSNNSSGGAWMGMDGHGWAWMGMDGHGWGMAPEIQQILAIDYRKHPRF